jgi:hypothetical protein
MTGLVRRCLLSRVKKLFLQDNPRITMLGMQCAVAVAAAKTPQRASQALVGAETSVRNEVRAVVMHGVFDQGRHRPLPTPLASSKRRFLVITGLPTPHDRRGR